MAPKNIKFAACGGDPNNIIRLFNEDDIKSMIKNYIENNLTVSVNRDDDIYGDKVEVSLFLEDELVSSERCIIEHKREEGYI